MKKKLLNVPMEIDPMDGDYSLQQYPDTYLTRLMLKANELGLEGRKIEVIEVKENFATGRRYVDFIEKP